MKILLIEDDAERIKVFKMMFSEHHLDVTCNANYAIELIHKNKYDCILLDHDLGGTEVGYMHYLDDNTGYRVARCIPKSINYNTYCVVHSWNPYSGKIMYDYLNDNSVPVDKKLFGTFSNEILKNVG